MGDKDLEKSESNTPAFKSQEIDLAKLLDNKVSNNTEKINQKFEGAILDDIDEILVLQMEAYKAALRHPDPKVRLDAAHKFRMFYQPRKELSITTNMDFSKDTLDAVGGMSAEERAIVEHFTKAFIREQAADVIDAEFYEE